jgi:hypothetical protein
LRSFRPRLYPAAMPKPSKTGNAPATKADIGMLMDEIGRLYDANQRWKDEIIGTLDERIDSRIAASEKRMQHHFGLAVENIRAELVGANKDRIENHEGRIARLEDRIGLAA